jgi:hypothetical protein
VNKGKGKGPKGVKRLKQRKATRFLSHRRHTKQTFVFFIIISSEKKIIIIRKDKVSLEIDLDPGHILVQSDLAYVMQVAGFGVACVDQVLVMESYPKPDTKVRSLSSMRAGGGNIGNSLTAMARLTRGPPYSWPSRFEVWTKVGDDDAGNLLLNEFSHEGIDCTHVVVYNNDKTGVTYVIVDQKNSTRTCIHDAPRHDFTIADAKFELGKSRDGAMQSSPDLVYPALNNLDIIHFDSRHVDGAFAVAQAAISSAFPPLLSIDGGSWDWMFLVFHSHRGKFHSTPSLVSSPLLSSQLKSNGLNHSIN